MSYSYFHGSLTNYSLTKEYVHSNKASFYILDTAGSITDLFNTSLSSDPYSIPAVFYTATASNFTYNFPSYYNKFSSISSFNSSSEASNDIHPIALRYETTDYLFYERKPFLCTSTYKANGAYSLNKHEPYTFWVPWTLYVVSKRDNYVYAYISHKQLTSKDDIYIPLVFPNSYPNGNICMGQSADQITSAKDSSYRQYFDTLINNYWSGSWNSDLSNHFTQISRAKYHSLPFGLHRTLRKDYPLFSSFLYFDESVIDKISEIHPKKIVSFAKKNAHIDYSNNYQDDLYRRLDHKRLLIFLSTLNLNETLRFYQEAARFLKDFYYNNGYSENYIDTFASINNSRIFEKSSFSQYSFGSEISSVFSSLNSTPVYNYSSNFINTFSVFFNSSFPHPFAELTINSSATDSPKLYNSLFYSLLTSTSNEYDSLRSVIYPIIFSMNSNTHSIISQSEDGSFYLSHVIPFEDFGSFSKRFDPSSQFYHDSYLGKSDYSDILSASDSPETKQLTSFLYESLETPYFYSTDPFLSRYSISLPQHS